MFGVNFKDDAIIVACRRLEVVEAQYTLLRMLASSSASIFI